MRKLSSSSSAVEESGHHEAAEKAKRSVAPAGRVEDTLMVYRFSALDLRPSWSKEPSRKVFVPPTMNSSIAQLSEDPGNLPIQAEKSCASSQLGMEGDSLSSCRYRFIANPGSTKRLYWDLTGAGLIGYDTVTIPFAL